METIGRSGGLHRRGIAAIGAVTFVLLGASAVARGREIRVKFLDGRTGRPVVNDVVASRLPAAAGAAAAKAAPAKAAKTTTATAEAATAAPAAAKSAAAEAAH